MNDNKSLQLKKGSIFTKIMDFIKSLFQSHQQTNLGVTNTEINKETKTEFLSNIKLESQEDPKLIKIQKQLENHEIDVSTLSNQVLHDLNILYDRQISNLKQKLNDKRTELNNMKRNIENNATTM